MSKDEKATTPNATDAGAVVRSADSLRKAATAAREMLRKILMADEDMQVRQSDAQARSLIAKSESELLLATARQKDQETAESAERSRRDRERHDAEILDLRTLAGRRVVEFFLKCRREAPDVFGKMPYKEFLALMMLAPGLWSTDGSDPPVGSGESGQGGATLILEATPIPRDEVASATIAVDLPRLGETAS